MQDVVIEIGNIFYLTRMSEEKEIEVVNQTFLKISEEENCSLVTLYPVIQIDNNWVDKNTGEIFENLVKLCKTVV